MEALKAEAQLNVAVAKRKLLTDYTSRMRSAELELETRQAELELQRAKRELAAHRARAEAEIAAVKARAELTSARLSRIEEEVAKCKIHAPADGTVRRANLRIGVRQPELRTGAIVRQGQRLLEIELDNPGARAKTREPSHEKE